MKDKDEPAFADAKDNNDTGPSVGLPPLLLLGTIVVLLLGGEDAVAMASDRASSVVGFKPKT
jgi:hypothetical protein